MDVRNFEIQRIADRFGPPTAEDEDYLNDAVCAGIDGGLTAQEIVALIDELERRWKIRLHPVSFRRD